MLGDASWRKLGAYKAQIVSAEKLSAVWRYSGHMCVVDDCSTWRLKTQTIRIFAQKTILKETGSARATFTCYSFVGLFVSLSNLIFRFASFICFYMTANAFFTFHLYNCYFIRAFFGHRLRVISVVSKFHLPPS